MTKARQPHKPQDPRKSVWGDFIVGTSERAPVPHLQYLFTPKENVLSMGKSKAQNEKSQASSPLCTHIPHETAPSRAKGIFLWGRGTQKEDMCENHSAFPLYISSPDWEKLTDVNTNSLSNSRLNKRPDTRI